ncbi:Hypothetical predicted protein [Cloeon dipterum]|uniref:Peptidase S1 domain-containing protein n=1 Tax=Cloeon dipterum TaxID=197152 RepID=A0A8S1CGP4_9INSE|nr:Hypothetical predicted protein [Cloeon dipterum]
MSGPQRRILLGLQILVLLSAVIATDDSSSGNGKWHHPMHILNPNENLGPQIIGGSVAAAGVFPWHALLQIIKIGTNSGYLCGASLIAAKYAMSACHCIKSPSEYTHDVVLGIVNRITPTAGYVKKTVATPVCHESYVAATTKNDIALLPFDSPVTTTSNIQFINLPQPSLASTDLVGTNANVSGFGRISDSNNTLSTTLQYATLTVTSDESCSAEYGATYSADVMLCAKAPAGDQADCQGDSGGSLVYNNGTAWVQIGIVSWGGQFCQNTSSVYARVTTFVDWVTSKMSALDGGGANTTTTKAPPTTTAKATTTAKTKATTTAKTKPTTTKKTTTTKAPTTTKPQCASKDFKNLQTKCCSPPAKDLLPKSYNKTIENTCKKIGGDNSAFNLFVLNKVQNNKKNNTVNITDVAGLAKQLSKSACYISCYLNQSGIVDSSTGDIDVDALTTLLTANQDPTGPWVENISGAVSYCTSLVTVLPLPDLPSGKVKCNPRGGVVVQCVLATLIELCPSRVMSKSCNSDYALFDQCISFVMDALFNSPGV